MGVLSMIALMNYKKMNTPTFDCWTFDSIIPNRILNSVITVSAVFKWGLIEGKRTDKNYRIWMHNYEIQSFKSVCKLFDSQETKQMFSAITESDLTNCRTRIELCKDEAGSWLHNHYDDRAKLFTLQLYLSDSIVSTRFDSTSSQAKFGSGWFFRNTATELHGLPELTKRRISIIVNYVDDTWRDGSVLV